MECEGREEVSVEQTVLETVKEDTRVVVDSSAEVVAQSQRNETTDKQQQEQPSQQPDGDDETNAEAPGNAAKDTLESCTERVKQRITYFKELSAWDNEDVLKRLKNISKVYWNHSKWRQSIGDCLAEQDFAGK